MFTLVICLVVVALSGAAVLHITLADQSQRATPQPRRPRDAVSHAPEVLHAPGVQSAPEPAPDPDAPSQPEVDVEIRRGSAGQPAAAPRSPASPITAPAQARRSPSPPPLVIKANRARSAGLLVLLVTTIGGVLALVVAVVALIVVVALRSALVG